MFVGTSKAKKPSDWREALSVLVSRIIRNEVEPEEEFYLLDAPEYLRLTELLAERKDAQGVRIGHTAVRGFMGEEANPKLLDLSGVIRAASHPADYSLDSVVVIKCLEAIARDVEAHLPQTYEFLAPICFAPVPHGIGALSVALDGSSDFVWMENRTFVETYFAGRDAEAIQFDLALGTFWCRGRASGYLPAGYGWERVLLKQEKILNLLLTVGYLHCDFDKVRENPDEPVDGYTTDVWYSTIAAECGRNFVAEWSGERTQRILSFLRVNWEAMVAAGVQRLPNTPLPIARTLDRILERTALRSNLFDAAEWWVDSQLQHDPAHQVLSLATAFEVFFAEDDAPADLENRRMSGYLADEFEDADLVFRFGKTSPEGAVAALLRTRLAYLLGQDHYDRLRISRTFNAFYDLRSRIVHQGRRRLGPAENSLLATVSGYLSDAIHREAIAIQPEGVAE